MMTLPFCSLARMIVLAASVGLAGCQGGAPKTSGPSAAEAAPATVLKAEMPKAEISPAPEAPEAATAPAAQTPAQATHSSQAAPAAHSSQGAQASPGVEKGRKVTISEAIDRGANWLIAKQNPDGGYGPSFGVKDASDVGLTAFALYALARVPRKYKEHDGPYVSKAVEFIASRQQADGAIYDLRDPSLQNYKTSVAVLAFAALDRKKYAAAIDKAAKFIKAQQFDEGQGFVKDQHAGFGGIGYGSDKGRPDLSNSQFAAEALHEAGVSGAEDVWVRLQVFLARCQNSSVEDPLVRAAGVRSTGDGGFRYQPTGTRGLTESLDGDQVFSSYGSMTYAGLRSMLYAEMKKEDPRVQEAFRWIRNNFSVKENPGMATSTDPSKGLQGLFYYYHTMAKALAIYGDPVLVDDKGMRHNWPKELGEHLASLQASEGFWSNASERWMEGIEVLSTSYTLVALSICKEELDRLAANPQLLDPAPQAPAAGGASQAPGPKN